MNPEEYREKIKAKYKLNDKAVDEIFEEAKKRLEISVKASVTPIPEQQLEGRMNFILSSMLSKRVNSKAVEFEGIFFTDSGVRKTNERQKREILEKFHKDPLEREKLLTSGEVKIIDKEPIVFDMRKEMYGKENKDYGKEIRIEKKRILQGIVKEIKEEGEEEKAELQKVVLKLKNSTLNEEVPLNSIIRFKATKFTGGETLFLFLEDGTVEMVERDVTNLIEIIGKYYGKNIIAVKDVEERLKAINENRAGRFVIVKGTIEDYNPEKPSIHLRDSNIKFEELVEGGAAEVMSLYVRIPENFDGAKYSECYVMGNLWRFNDMLGMTARGFICPEKRVKTEKIEDVKMESGGDEKEW